MNWTLETIEQFPLLAGLINSLSCQNYDMYQKIKDGNIHILVVVFVPDQTPTQYFLDIEELTIKKINCGKFEHYQLRLNDWFCESDYFEQIKKRFAYMELKQWLSNNYIAHKIDHRSNIYQSKVTSEVLTGEQAVDLYWQEKRKYNVEFNIIKREFLKQVLGDKILKH